MALDFTIDINNVTRQIRQYLRRDQPIPKCTLEHYNTLVGATLNAQTLESGTSDFPVGALASSFPAVPITDTTILAANTSRTYLLLQNIGSDTVYINFGGAAALAGGIQLLPGAEFSTQVTQFTEAELHAIADTNPSALAVYEIA